MSMVDGSSFTAKMSSSGSMLMLVLVLVQMYVGFNRERLKVD